MDEIDEIVNEKIKKLFEILKRDKDYRDTEKYCEDLKDWWRDWYSLDKTTREKYDLLINNAWNNKGYGYKNEI